jgi:hypothetical protein
LPRWIKIGLALVVAVIGGAVVAVATHWPFTRSDVTHALEQKFGGTVEIKSFRETYFAPGCVAEGVTIRRNRDKDAPPIVTADKIRIRGNYLGFFTIPKRIVRVRVEGLHVFVSPQSERLGSRPGNNGDQNKVLVEEIVANGALVEFAAHKLGRPPLRFDIHTLTLNGVADDRPMAFHTVLTNPEPPGEIRADGQFGPLLRDDVGQTAVSGSYVFEDANLGVFHGIKGTLASEGNFNGVLQELSVEANTDVPDFQVTRSKHSLHLKTHFQALVNGTNGDVELRSVAAQFGKTWVSVRGEVASKKGSGGKVVSLAGKQQRGTIQDWLKLLAQAEKPAMTGAMTFQAQVRVPPGDRELIQRVILEGDFVIGSADFTLPDTQHDVDKLSQVAMGEKPNEELASVVENMKGHVVMKGTLATFTDLYFSVPGAVAHMHGNYGILTKKIDLHGDLRVDHKLSKGETGVKSVLMKFAEPFLKKKKQGEIVPIKMGGTYGQPTYGLDIAK